MLFVWSIHTQKLIHVLCRRTVRVRAQNPGTSHILRGDTVTYWRNLTNIIKLQGCVRVLYVSKCMLWTNTSNRTGVNTGAVLNVAGMLLTRCNHCWLYVTAVRLILCGQNLSRVAGGNFTLCKQEKESAERNIPEGNSPPSNLRRSTFLTSGVTHTLHTYTFAIVYKRC